MLAIYAVCAKGYMIGSAILVSNDWIFHAFIPNVMNIDIMVNRSVIASPEC